MENEKLKNLSTDKLIATVKDTVYNSIGYEEVIEHVLLLEESKKLYKNLKYFKFVNENEVKEMPEIVKEVIENVNQSTKYHKDKISQILKPIISSKKELGFVLENLLTIAVEKATTDNELEDCAEAIEIFIDDIEWANAIRKNIYGGNWLENNENRAKSTKSIPFEDAMNFLQKNEPVMIEFYKDTIPIY